MPEDIFFLNLMIVFVESSHTDPLVRSSLPPWTYDVVPVDVVYHATIVSGQSMRMNTFVGWMKKITAAQT